MQLSDQIALVTGAGQGIGKARRWPWPQPAQMS